jgi:glucoamylase
MPSDALDHPGVAPTRSGRGGTVHASRRRFTIRNGIVNENSWPRIDVARIRDLGFIVADDRGFWFGVKRLEGYRVRHAAPSIPAVRIIHDHPRFSLCLRAGRDASRQVLQIEVCLSGDEQLKVYALLAHRLGGSGENNHAGCTGYRGQKVLWAERGSCGLALAAVNPKQHDAWGRTSAGHVGVSEGWRDFASHARMTETLSSAGPGSVALIGELPYHAVLALAFGTSKESAATLAISSLLNPFEDVWGHQIDEWQRQQTPGGLSV